MSAAERWDDPIVARDIDEIRSEVHWFTKTDADEARGEDQYERDIAGGPF